jgi:hypothetical protein
MQSKSVRTGRSGLNKVTLSSVRVISRPHSLISIQYVFFFRARGQRLLINLLVQLPRPILVDAAPKRSTFAYADDEGLKLTHACRYSSASIPQRRCLTQLAEQHRNELKPFTPFLDNNLPAQHLPTYPQKTPGFNHGDECGNFIFRPLVDKCTSLWYI